MDHQIYLSTMQAIFKKDSSLQAILDDISVKTVAVNGVPDPGFSQFLATTCAAVYTGCKDGLFTEITQAANTKFFNTGKAPDITKLPLIISGPIVRHTAADNVTVWVALKSSISNVVLTVYENNSGNRGAAIFSSGTVATLTLGNSLHAACITARPIVSNKLLDYGQTYLYDLTFNGKSLADDGIFGVPGTGSANIKSLLGYYNYTLPSFKLPPLELNDIHILQGSCRNIDGVAFDTMPAIDALFTAVGESRRPQQLFLTGDQIYADEGNEPLEQIIVQSGNALMTIASPVTAEKMPGADNCIPFNVFPGDRGGDDITGKPDFIHDSCGFTPTSRFHLFSLSDYSAAYLLSWSDVLWPAFYKDDAVKAWAYKQVTALKNNADNGFLNSLDNAAGRIEKYELPLRNRLKVLIKNLNSLDTDVNSDTAVRSLRALITALAQLRNSIANLAATIHLVVFVGELPKVRRAMANISTYMIFDDHEVTDDWHMTREWAERAYSMPMARRVMQNALAAYSIFQGWGNAPDQFADPVKSGRKLLNAISAWVVSGYQHAPSEAQIGQLLKIPDPSQVGMFQHIGRGNPLPAIFPDAVVWCYQVNHPRYEVLVLDTRTFRNYPNSSYSGAEHLTDAAILNQLPKPANQPPLFTGKRREVTIIISPCNIITIPLFRNFMTGVGLPLAQYLKNYDGSRWKMTAYDPDQSDSWEVSSKVFETFMSRLAVRSFNPGDTDRDSKVVIFSGDVHFTFAGRMGFWADRPLNADQSIAHSMVVAALTSSGIKQETGSWRDLKLEEIGYDYSDFGTTTTRLPEPEIMIGYAKKPAAIDKPKQDDIILRTRWFPNYKPSMILKEPLMLPGHKIHPAVAVPKPEWMYRLDFIRGAKTEKPLAQRLFVPMDIARSQNPGSELIAHSNFASVTFDWEGEGKLKAPLDAGTTGFAVLTTPDKLFPPAPFYVVIENEIIYVSESSTIPGNTETNFTIAIRGKADSIAAAHAINTPVKIRKAVTQNIWVVSAPKKATDTSLLQSLKTIYKVAMTTEDPQYKRPTLNTL